MLKKKSLTLSAITFTSPLPQGIDNIPFLLNILTYKTLYLFPPFPGLGLTQFCNFVCVIIRFSRFNLSLWINCSSSIYMFVRVFPIPLKCSLSFSNPYLKFICHAWTICFVDFDCSLWKVAINTFP